MTQENSKEEYSKKLIAQYSRDLFILFMFGLVLYLLLGTHFYCFPSVIALICLIIAAVFRSFRFFRGYSLGLKKN